jgi:hypothetical protein
MRALLINPFDRTVTEIEHNGSLEAMRETIRCQTVCTVQLTDRETLWLDDEGMLVEGTPVFSISGSDQAFAGIGLILGSSPAGNNIASRLPTEAVKTAINWTDKESTGDFTRPIARENVLIMGTPILRDRQLEGAQ